MVQSRSELAIHGPFEDSLCLVYDAKEDIILLDLQEK